jgi:hypothetical protein
MYAAAAYIRAAASRADVSMPQAYPDLDLKGRHRVALVAPADPLGDSPD